MSSVSSHGYVLIYVGKDHYLADVRGYAYEHRIVAEEKLGCRLLPGEVVHHINGIKADNDPLNREVLESIAVHRFKHRNDSSRLRLPGESNPHRDCKCGCGSQLLRYDSVGRERAYLSGHNTAERNRNGRI